MEERDTGRWERGRGVRVGWEREGVISYSIIEALGHGDCYTVIMLHKKRNVRYRGNERDVRFGKERLEGLET